MIYVKKWLTSKVFIRRANSGYWEVLLGSRDKNNLPKGCYGLVLDRFVNQPDARDARNAYDELITWRNDIFTVRIASAKNRAAVAKAFKHEPITHKWKSTKILIEKQKNTSMIGVTYKIKLANNFVPTKKWITLKTDLISSSIAAIEIAKHYTELIEFRNSVKLDALPPAPAEATKDFALTADTWEDGISAEDVWAYDHMW